MQENSNKIIFYNSIILYVRLILTSFFALLCTRFTLQALGTVDFGLFSLLGSIITFISIINTIMLSTSNRFIAVEIGKGTVKSINEQFNINLLIHCCIALLTLLFAYPIGDWYINNYLNFSGDLNIAIQVFHFTIVGSALSFIGVPYQGLLMAKEKFLLFCLTDVFCSLLKLLLAYLLIYYFTNKLQIYAFGISILTVIPTCIYSFYCHFKYKNLTTLKFVSNIQKYKEVFAFSAWVSYGAVATVARVQGAALIVNMFFNTLLNAAMGIASSINNMVSMVAGNITKSLEPQITKSYASGDYDRCNKLLIVCTKYGYLVMLLISVPFLTNMKWILNLWLGEVPPYAEIFSILTIIDLLVVSLNSGISNLIFASGKIKLYQLVTNTLRLFSLIVGYLVLKAGNPPEFLFVAYILVSVLVFFAIQYILHVTLHYSNKTLFFKSYLPSLAVTACFLPCMFLNVDIHPLVEIILVMMYMLVVLYVVGLCKSERLYIKSFLKQRLKK